MRRIFSAEQHFSDPWVGSSALNRAGLHVARMLASTAVDGVRTTLARRKWPSAPGLGGVAGGFAQPARVSREVARTIRTGPSVAGAGTREGIRRVRAGRMHSTMVRTEGAFVDVRDVGRSVRVRLFGQSRSNPGLRTAFRAKTNAETRTANAAKESAATTVCEPLSRWSKAVNAITSPGTPNRSPRR